MMLDLQRIWIEEGRTMPSSGTSITSHCVVWKSLFISVFIIFLSCFHYFSLFSREKEIRHPKTSGLTEFSSMLTTNTEE